MVPEACGIGGEAPHEAHSGPKGFPTLPAWRKQTLVSLSTPWDHSIADANERIKRNRHLDGIYKVSGNGP